MSTVVAQLFDPQKQEQAIKVVLSSLSKQPPEEGITPEEVWNTPGLPLLLIGFIANSYRFMERCGDAEECITQLQDVLDLLVTLSASKSVAESIVSTNFIVTLLPYLHLPHTPPQIQFSLLLIFINIAAIDEGPWHLIDIGILPLVVPLLAGKSSEGLFTYCAMLLHSLVSAVAKNPSGFAEILPAEKISALSELLVELLLRMRPEGMRDWHVSFVSLRSLLLTISLLKDLKGFKGHTDSITKLKRLCTVIKDTDTELAATLRMSLSE